jgi:FG-GAP-like repeat
VAQLGFPNAVAVGRLNRDAVPDVVLAHAAGFVSVLLRDGTGRLSPAGGSPSATGGSNAVALALADFNRDGNLDAAVANFDSNRVSVMLGDGTGHLAPAAGSPFRGAGDQPLAIATADFNHDGNPDVAVASVSGDRAAVLFGDGTGRLTPGPVRRSGPAVASVSG